MSQRKVHVVPAGTTYRVTGVDRKQQQLPWNSLRAYSRPICNVGNNTHGPASMHAQLCILLQLRVGSDDLVGSDYNRIGRIRDSDK